MITDSASVAALVDEYKSMLGSGPAVVDAEEELDWSSVSELLWREASWTQAGADHVASLVRHYGSFVLRNALALALAMDIEDGEAGL